MYHHPRLPGFRPRQQAFSALHQRPLNHHPSSDLVSQSAVATPSTARLEATFLAPAPSSDGRLHQLPAPWVGLALAACLDLVTITPSRSTPTQLRLSDRFAPGGQSAPCGTLRHMAHRASDGGGTHPENPGSVFWGLCLWKGDLWGLFQVFSEKVCFAQSRDSSYSQPIRRATPSLRQARSYTAAAHTQAAPSSSSERDKGEQAIYDKLS